MKLKDVIIDMHQGINTVADKVDYIDYGIPIIQSKNFTKGFLDLNDVRYLGQEDESKYIDKYNPHVGDILMANIGTIGKTFVIEKEERFLIAWNAFLIKPNNELVKSKFLKFYFDYLLSIHYYDKLLTGGTVKFINKKKISEIPFPHFTLNEQEKIIERLSLVEKIIVKRGQQLQQLDELVKARFVEMFGEVGTDEKGWGFARLGDVCKINPKKTDDLRLKSGLHVSFVPMPAVSEKGEIDPSETKLYDEVKSGFTYFREDDVLFAKITPCMENGKGAVAKGLRNGIGFGSTEFHVLRPTESISNPYWLYAVTSFDQFRIDAASNMTGSAGQRRVPASFLESYRISVPPIELQEQFETFVEHVDKSKVAVQKALDEAQTLFDSLMQQYFG